MRNKEIQMCKVQWSHHTVEEPTWEREEVLKEEFPSFFSNHSKSRDEILVKGGRFVTSYFLKRIGCYLNKYLFVAFHADAYFPLSCEVFLYFIGKEKSSKFKFELHSN
jgi:hypothetical protein